MCRLESDGKNMIVEKRTAGSVKTTTKEQRMTLEEYMRITRLASYPKFGGKAVGRI